METYKEANVYPNEVREEVQNADEILDHESYSFLNNEDEIHVFNQKDSNKTLPKFVAHQQKKRDIIMDDASSVPSKKAKEITVVTNGSYKSDISDSDSQKLDSFSENQSYLYSSTSKSSSRSDSQKLDSFSENQSYLYNSTSNSSSTSQTTRADVNLHSYLQKRYTGKIIRSSNGSSTGIEEFAYSDMEQLEKVLEEVPQSRLLGYV